METDGLRGTFTANGAVSNAVVVDECDEHAC